MAPSIPFGFFLLLVSLTGCIQGASMFFKKGEEVEIVLFSPLEGTLMFEGKPAAGATLSLWIKWQDTEGEYETFRADELGRFSIPKKTARYRDNPLRQLVIAQEITVNYQNQNYLIWSAGKSLTEEYSELGGRPEGVVCELTGELEVIRSDDLLMGTTCRWAALHPVEGRHE